MDFHVQENTNLKALKDKRNLKGKSGMEVKSKKYRTTITVPVFQRVRPVHLAHCQALDSVPLRELQRGV
jgi:hypothetical protein